MVVYDFSSASDYVHQVGRTGRTQDAGGKAVTFYVEGDGDAKALVGLLRRGGQSVTPQLESIAASEEEGPNNEKRKKAKK